MKKSLTFTLIIAATGLCASQWMMSPEKPASEQHRLAEKINLALRQTGHQLLALAGDDTSAIPPIRQKAGNEFLLKLECGFNYDTLPYVLANALSNYGITSEYQVAIKNCQTGTVILGYNLLAFENKNVACMGREQEVECSDISVTFSENANMFNGQTLITFSLALLSLLLMIRLYLFQKNKNLSTKDSLPQKENLIHLGRSVFDFNNQSIEINGGQKELTFRENKLLLYFAYHPNQVLEREKILSEVWGDEGVIVGRSLDVFVSRLRKILSEDASLKIKNVHGVGYRLEVGA